VTTASMLAVVTKHLVSASHRHLENVGTSKSVKSLADVQYSTAPLVLRAVVTA